MKKGLLAGVAVFFLAAPWGCASLPEARPFVEATQQLRSALIAGGSAVEAELRLAGEKEPKDEALSRSLEKSAEEFSRQWKLRVQAADGLAAYSESLAVLVRSGQEGAEGARKLADSAAEMARAVGVSLPPAGVVSAISEGASFIYRQIATARAARSLGEALGDMQPGVERLTAVMGQDFGDSENILVAAYHIQMTRLSARYNEELGYFRDLAGEQREIYRKPARAREDEKRLLELDQLLEATQPWRSSLENEKREAEKRLRAGRHLLSAVRQGLAEWAFAHKQLAGAVRERRSVDAQSLVQATRDIRELIRRIREL